MEPVTRAIWDSRTPQLQVPIEILASPQEKANPLPSSRKTFSTRR